VPKVKLDFAYSNVKAGIQGRHESYVQEYCRERGGEGNGTKEKTEVGAYIGNGDTHGRPGAGGTPKRRLEPWKW